MAKGLSLNLPKGEMRLRREREALQGRPLPQGPGGRAPSPGIPKINMMHKYDTSPMGYKKG